MYAPEFNKREERRSFRISFASIMYGNYTFFFITKDLNPCPSSHTMSRPNLTGNGRPVIVDTGTSTYEVNNTRFYERSTAAHNTVVALDNPVQLPQHQ